MITEEIIRIDGRELVRRRSDGGKMLLQAETGAVYEEALDVLPCPYSYSETDEPIPAEGEAEAADYEAALARLGVSI